MIREHSKKIWTDLDLIDDDLGRFLILNFGSLITRSACYCSLLATHVIPITKKQKDLYDLLGIKPPARTMTDQKQSSCEIS